MDAVGLPLCRARNTAVSYYPLWLRFTLSHFRLFTFGVAYLTERTCDSHTLDRGFTRARTNRTGFDFRRLSSKGPEIRTFSDETMLALAHAKNFDRGQRKCDLQRGINIWCQA